MTSPKTPKTSPPNNSKEEEDEFWLFGYGSLIWKPPPHFDRRVPGYIKGYVRRFWQASEDHRGTPESPGRVVTLIDHEYWKEFLREQDEDRYHDDNPSSPSSAPIVWGAAYRIPPQYVETVKTYLDIREINGYSIQHTDFYPASSSPPPLPPPDPTTATTSTSSAPQTTSSKPPEAIKNTLLYIGLPSNPNFLGALHPRHVSAVIAASKGPSGENAEYLFMLEDALEGLGPGCGDDHVRGLGARVRALLLLEETRDSKKSDDGGGKDHGLKGMIKTSSVDERTTGDEQAETEKP